MAAEPFFTLEGTSFAPTDQSRGPWGNDSLHGRVVVGLLAREFEQQHGDPAFQVARLTTDLFRMPRFAPLEVTSSVVREGNRIRVIDGVVTSQGREIAQARAVMLRRADQPEDDIWGPAAWDVPAPDSIEAPAPRGDREPMWDTRPIDGGFGSAGQRRAWIRETRTLIEGEDLTPFLRVALAADYTNPFANSGTDGLNFVNADVTLYLHRLPTTEWVGFEVNGHHSAEGIAVAECTLYDEQGNIGRSAVTAVANEHR
jgi:hypothetical protein